MNKELVIPYENWKSNYCCECGKDMTNQESFWKVFREFGGKVYQVKICDDCEDPYHTSQKQIDFKNYFKELLIQNNLYDVFCAYYKIDFNKNKYCFDNINRDGEDIENWKEYFLISFSSYEIKFSEQFILQEKYEIGKSFINPIIDMLLKNGFEIIQKYTHIDNNSINIELVNNKTKEKHLKEYEEEKVKINDLKNQKDNIDNNIISNIIRFEELKLLIDNALKNNDKNLFTLLIEEFNAIEKIFKMNIEN
jgi:septum formation topological specificity factor MinE